MATLTGWRHGAYRHVSVPRARQGAATPRRYARACATPCPRITRYAQRPVRCNHYHLRIRLAEVCRTGRVRTRFRNSVKARPEGQTNMEETS